MRLAAAICAICLGLLFGLPGGAALPPERLPSVAVVDSLLAEQWLAQAGIPFRRQFGAILGDASLAGVRLLILPVASVATPTAARAVESYVARGGRVVAVYWGTVVPPGERDMPPFQLSELLGVRPVLWVGEAPREVVLHEAGAGVMPSAGPRVTLPVCQAVVVEPLAGTRVVGRWGSGDSEESSAPLGNIGAVFQRGNVVYVAPNILRAANDRAEVRELFFWAIQLAAPEFGPGLQARDRIAAAATACGAVPSAGAESGALLRAMDSARAAMREARSFLSKNPVRASQAADRARRIAERLAEKLRAVPGS